MNHLSKDDLQNFVDNACDENSRYRIASHLQICDECKSRIEGMVKLGNIIRSIPLDRTSDSFTARVMRKIPSTKAASFIWLFFKNLAPVFGLIVVVGIVYIALTISGIIGGLPTEQTNGMLSVVYEQVNSQVSTATSAFIDWLKRAFPFLYTKGGLSVIAMLIILAVAAILDKYLFIPFFRRRG
jgi:anti-sigma factor RsiW